MTHWTWYFFTNYLGIVILLTRGHPFGTYAKFPEKLIFLPLVCTPTSVYQGVRNVRFSENFAYELNEWSLNYIEFKILDFIVVFHWIQAVADHVVAVVVENSTMEVSKDMWQRMPLFESNKRNRSESISQSKTY